MSIERLSAERERYIQHTGKRVTMRREREREIERERERVIRTKYRKMQETVRNSRVIMMRDCLGVSSLCVIREGNLAEDATLSVKEKLQKTCAKLKKRN